MGTNTVAPERRLDTLLLERWVRDPTATALIAGDERVTAGDLGERALWVADALAARGVGPGDRVAVYQERSVAFVVSVLGVLMAGAAHVAFDVGDPAERTLGMIDDCGPRVLLTTEALAPRLPAALDTLIVTGRDRGRPLPAEPADTAPRPADDPAVVLYTSGSTGRPKASLISHGALVSRLTALQRTHPMSGDDRIIHHTACTFDMFLIEVYWPLLAGATVVIADPGRQRDAAHLAHLISEFEVTTFYCVVSLLELFLLARDPAERYDGLRQVLTGGEPLSPELVRRFHSRSTATLTNLYGPSECTIYCTAWVCPRDPGLDTVLIGTAVDETSLWILDPHGRPVPEGETGELYIGGAGLALGYLNRPELTAQRFVPDRLGKSGGRLYRSGDLVRQLPDGALEYLGRADQQIKIRGVRIEPGEIESTALACPGVRQAAVVAQGEGSGKRLVAFVVPAGEVPPDDLVPALRAHLRSLLPAALVPTRIEVADALPLARNGKLDRSALSLRAADPPPAPEPTAPLDVTRSGELERVVADVWRAAVEAPEIDPDEDFFDIGGDSFRAVRVVRTLQELLDVRIPLETLLENPTVDSFSTAVRNLVKREHTR